MSVFVRFALIAFLLMPFAVTAEPPALTGLKCTSLQCEFSDGGPAGVATIEAVGSLPQYAGTALRLGFLQIGSSKLIFERKVGVMSNGKLTLSLPLSRLSAGEYAFALFTFADAKRAVAGGVFQLGGAPPAVPAKEDAAPNPANSSGNSTFQGEWRGINGTAGLLVISSGGSYTFNGAKGSYRASGTEIVFTGPLQAWNGGKAKLNQGVIEFIWQRGDTMWNQFYFARVK